MRAGRLLWLLLSLQTEGRLTADVLASRFEVSERTIYRDVDALAMAGVPIYTQAGPRGGIFLDEQYRTSLTGLSLAELHALFVSAEAKPLADLGLAEAVPGMSLKLLAALPSEQQQEVQRLRQRFLIDSAHWFDYTETPSILPDLQQAVWEDREIVVAYRNYEGVASAQVLQAYALVAKANIWYLVARRPNDTYRTYRTTRLITLTVTDRHFARDAAFDLAHYWKEASHDFEQMRATTFPFYPVVLRLTTTALQTLCDYIPARYNILEEADASGWLTLHVLFLSLHEARMHVLGLGDQVCICEPSELEAHVRASVNTLAATYR